MLWTMIKGSMVGHTTDDHFSSFGEDGVWMLVWHHQERRYNGMHNEKVYFIGHFI